MTDRYQLEFNGQEFRVIEIDADGDRRRIGAPSQDLHLVLRSACKDLGDQMLVFKLEVVPK